MTLLKIVVSIHAPRAGCDLELTAIVYRIKCFNPRTPRGVRPKLNHAYVIAKQVSIHAPRAGCDKRHKSPLIYDDMFQSTHPARGATDYQIHPHSPSAVSIHAPRAGCDPPRPTERHSAWSFNPRTPRGVRHSGPHPLPTSDAFQSTHPARGATRVPQGNPTQPSAVSIHAPRAGCDGNDRSLLRPNRRFNPRTPRGVRRKLYL